MHGNVCQKQPASPSVHLFYQRDLLSSATRTPASTQNAKAFFLLNDEGGFRRHHLQIVLCPTKGGIYLMRMHIEIVPRVFLPRSNFMISFFLCGYEIYYTRSHLRTFMDYHLPVVYQQSFTPFSCTRTQSLVY